MVAAVAAASGVGATAADGVSPREIPVFATLHLADLFHDPRMTAPTLRDWSKVKAYRAGTWPRPLPGSCVIGEEGGEAAAELMAEAWRASYLAVDTEYHAPPGMAWEDIPRSGAILDLVGVGWSEPGGKRDRVIQCPWGPPTPDRTAFAAWLQQIVRTVPVVFQNVTADVPLLAAHLGIEYSMYARVDDLMLAHAVLWSEWPHDLEFLASVYSLYPKTKHLKQADPLLYNRGDVADTVRCWAGVQSELAADAPSARVYERQSLPLVQIINRRMERGILTNQAAIEQAILALQAEKAAAARFAEAYTGTQGFNLGSPLQLQWWLYDVEGLPVRVNRKTKARTVDDEAVVALREAFDPVPDFEAEQTEPLTFEQAAARVERGAHPLLEARVIHAGAQQALSHYLVPMQGRERIYPNIALHAQASGRWSITGPPIQQFPRPTTPIGKLIQASLTPDPGTVWIGWDWKQIEPRIEAYLSGERALIELFESGGDPYKLYAQFFGWDPPTDEQRQFAKRHRLKMSYGGSEKSETPGAAKLGLTKADLTKAGAAMHQGLPRLAAYWRGLKNQALANRRVRTFDGRVRVLLGKSDKAMREALNHPHQGGVAGILNRTIIEICEALPWASLVYTVHDAGWIEVPAAREAEAEPVIRGIVGREWELRPGVVVRFPADFKRRSAIE